MEVVTPVLTTETRPPSTADKVEIVVQNVSVEKLARAQRFSSSVLFPEKVDVGSVGPPQSEGVKYEKTHGVRWTLWTSVGPRLGKTKNKVLRRGEIGIINVRIFIRLFPPVVLLVLLLKNKSFTHSLGSPSGIRQNTISTKVLIQHY